MSGTSAHCCHENIGNQYHRMWSQYTGVQGSATLNDVGDVPPDLRASYSAMERGITRPVKTNFHEHML